ncbi:DNA adenine methylase [candidate division KSB1 bacterium]|nr:DNA adenine methylase [candidate division KSB1 bacterium]
MNNGFLKYNQSIFQWEDQIRLADVATTLSNFGCKVLVSNADAPAIRALYPTFHVITIERSSVIAASSRHRKTVSECLFVS